MKKGLEIGQTYSLEVLVTEEMVASFAGKVVHNLFSTSHLVKQMEHAARNLILPYFEEDEEAMGYQVDVTHLSLTLPGMKVTITARVSEIRDNKIIAEVEAFNSRAKIARGKVTQALIKKSWLEDKMKEYQIVENIANSNQFNGIENSVSS